MENKNKAPNIVTSILTFFRFKAGEILAVFKSLGESYWKTLSFFVKWLVVFVLVFIIAAVISLFFYGLYKYFTPGLYIFAVIAIFSPFILLIIKKWKILFLFLSTGISWLVLLFAAGWEIHNNIPDESIGAALFGAHGFIPVYSMAATLLFWLIVNGGKIYSLNYNHPKKDSMIRKYIILFIKKYTSIQSKALFIIFLIQSVYTLFFQFNLRLILAVFAVAVTILLIILKVRKARFLRYGGESRS